MRKDEGFLRALVDWARGAGDMAGSTAVAAALLALVALVSPFGASSATTPSLHSDQHASRVVRAQSSVQLGDGRLRAAVEAARGSRPMPAGIRTRAGKIDVEILLSGPAADVKQTVVGFGGEVVGHAGTSLLEAYVPAANLPALERAPGVASLRAPLQANVPVASNSVNAAMALIQGDEVTKTNATAWHNAGITGGNVKIGIVDFFDGTRWNAAQSAGEVPAPGGTFCNQGGLTCDIWANNDAHGEGVAEVIHEMAPDAQLYLASATSVADLQAAVDWFASQGVQIVSRSLTSQYDGPGDGSGPMAQVVANAVTDGMAWFNSVGNSGGLEGVSAGSYWRGGWSDANANDALDFAPGDDALAFTCGFINGVRWNDWVPTKTDYDAYVYSDPGLTNLVGSSVRDQSIGGVDPIEYPTCNNPGATDYLVIRKFADGNGTASDTLEFMTNGTGIEYWQNAFSAAAPAVDVNSSGALSVGAIDPASGIQLATYSSQGPTNDGRFKPEITAASCDASFTFQPGCFNGTSASTAAAAGAAALIRGKGLATTPTQVKNWLLANAVVDRGDEGNDNQYGAGELILPAPPATTPGAPTGVTAVAGDSSAVVSWTPPAADGGSPITGYSITPYIGSTAQVPTLVGNVTSSPVTGLANGTTYTFRVRATNDAGSGDESADSNPVTPTTTVPGAPTNVSATAGDASASVSWTAPAADGGSPITSYTVTPYIGASAQTPTTVGVVTSTSITGLTNGTTYTFKVRASNANGAGPDSADSNSVTPMPPATVPGAPTGVSASAGDASAAVSWTAPASDGGSAITAYIVTPYVGVTPQATTTVGNVNATTITGLTNGTTYTFKVRAVNIVGQGQDSAASNSVTPAPAASVPEEPTGVSAVAGDASATVSWTAPVSDGGAAITGYVVTPFVGSTAQTPVSVGNVTLAVISGLTNGTTYTFRVHAVNSAGPGPDSAASNAVTPTAPTTAPGAPTGVSSTAGDASARVSWTPPASNGGSAITNYVVTPYLGASAQAPTTVGNVTSTSISGLTNGTTYTFKVHAVNAVGDGPDSVDSNAVTPTAAPTAPDAPTGVSATAGDASASVSWTAPASDGGSAITNYIVTPYIGSTPQPATQVGNVTSTSISGLTNGTTYTFKVRAVNAVGEGPDSSDSNAVTPVATPTVPDAPTGVTAVAGDAAATVSWTAPADGGSAISGYVVTPYVGSTAQTPVSVGNVTLAVISGLTNGTTYTFRVHAVNGVGDGPDSADSNAVTPTAAATVPDAPTGVSATAGDASASVSWTAPASDGGSAITSYVVTPYVGASAQAPTTVGNVTSTSISGLTNGTTYTFKVHAVNAVGGGPDSADSNSVTPTAAPTVPGAPTGVSATAGDASATVSWTAPGSDGGSVITSYVVTPYVGASAQAPTTVGNVTSAPISGLTNGTTYTFKVHAVNAVGDGPDSADSNGVTPTAAATAPGAPTAVTSTAGDASASVSWTAPASDGGSAITNYVVTPYVGASAQAPTTVGNVTSAPISGLTNGTTYTFRVHAVNAVGDGPDSADSNSVTPTAAATAPGAPTGVTATAGDASASVAWVVPASDGGSAITDYVVTPYIGSTAQTPVSVGNVTLAVISGLTNGTTYTFKVHAVNAVGPGPDSVESNSVTPTPAATVPGAPTGVSATAGDASASVSWTAPASDGGSSITDYIVTPYIGTTAQPATQVGNVTSTTISGLTNGTAYTFKVRAVNAVGEGPDSADSNAVTPTPAPTVPDAPTGVTAVAGDAAATVSWSAAAPNGSPVTDYVVTPYVGSTPQTPVSVGNVTLAAISGLTNGTTYTFKVHAVNGVGAGPDSAASNSVTPTAAATAPGAPTSVVATAGDASAGVSWTAPASDGGSAITNYVVTPYIGSTAQTPTTVGNVTSTTISGLTNGTAYTFKVHAVNAVGAGPDSAASNSVTPTPAATAPGAPTAVTATAGDASANVSWTAPASNGGSAITSYVVTPYVGSTAQPSTTVGNVTSTSISGLTNGTAYTFKVHAVNAVGAGPDSAASNSVTPTPAPTAPGAPTGVTATAGDASANVSWTAPVSNGGSAITSYVVTPYVGSTAQPATTVGNVTSTSISGLTNGTTYTFKVHAVNAVGAGVDSAASNTVTPMAAPTVPGAPTSVLAAAGDASANVSWTAPGSNGGSTITSYVVTPYVGSTAQPSTTVGNVTSTSISGLTNGTAYTFKVHAVNAVGAGPDSVASNTVTPTATATAPGAPTGVTASAGNASATVSWSAPASNGGSAITNYTVTPYIGTTAQTATTVGNVTSTSISGLTNGMAYSFKVKAVNAVGAGPDSASSNVVTPMASPTGFNWAANPSTDFDGDRITDLGALYRGRSPLDSLWFATSSAGGGPFQIFFGATTDVAVPGDYDGDGRTDAVIYRPQTGLWYGPRTGAAQIVIQMILGQPQDIPVPGDYDGDGKTDPAIYRPSTGMFFAVLSGGGTKSSTFGGPNDIPVPRDYDGDGKTDFGIYRKNVTPDHLGLWYAPLSGGGVYQIYFGGLTDIPVPGDYNGDRRAEAVIYRPSIGLWYGPYNGAPGLFQLQLGQSGDVPIPGYYDNDSKEDPAIYRPPAGSAPSLWFALKSTGGTSRIDGLGAAGDVAVQKRPALASGI